MATTEGTRRSWLRNQWMVGWHGANLPQPATQGLPDPASCCCQRFAAEWEFDAPGQGDNASAWQVSVPTMDNRELPEMPSLRCCDAFADQGLNSDTLGWAGATGYTALLPLPPTTTMATVAGTVASRVTPAGRSNGGGGDSALICYDRVGGWQWWLPQPLGSL